MNRSIWSRLKEHESRRGWYPLRSKLIYIFLVVMMSAQTESSHAFETLNGLRSRWSDDTIPWDTDFEFFP